MKVNGEKQSQKTVQRRVGTSDARRPALSTTKSALTSLSEGRRIRTLEQYPRHGLHLPGSDNANDTLGSQLHIDL